MLNILQQRTTAVLLALGWALASNAFSQRPPSAAESTIRVVSTQGMVQVQRAGANVWMPAQTNQSLFGNDRIRTGQRSRALLRWSEDSTLRLADRTEVRILPPAKPGALHDVDAAQGFFYFFHRGKPGELRVINRLVTAAIQGTEFSYEVDANDGTTRIAMFDGVVELSNAFGTERIRSGESAIVQPGQPPRHTAVLMGGGRPQWLGQWRDLIQWCLYYPAVLDVDEAGLAAAEQQALAESISAYRQGDLLQALENYPAERQPASAPEAVYLAALILSVGDVKQAEEQLRRLDDASLPGRTDKHRALADALRKLIASVKFQPWPGNAAPSLATEWMAESYQRQSRGQIDEAHAAALAATKQAPQFGFAWARLAELEFSRGHTEAALKALDRSLNLAPRNAQALSLKGFLLAARNHITAAIEWFNKAIAIDPALGNAWLGRGLCRIRRGDDAGGREDLLTAAALEPQRSLLRSYLGKAFAKGGDPQRALHELELAKHLDPADPTPWLYSALLNSDYNHINEAIRDLERSKELNDNRLVYRSRLLVEQDRAARRANLARLYADAGLADVGVGEAGTAVAADYGNYSAHLFLVNAYQESRSAAPYGQRYETPAFSEYLVASLLGPADGRLLSPAVSQQEYSKLLDRDGLGFYSSTEYLSRGAWRQTGVQYGSLGTASYALEVDYFTDPGQARYANLETGTLSAKVKQQLTAKDSVLLHVYGTRWEGGDVGQRHDPDATDPRVRFKEEQPLNLLLGYHREWSEASHTLLLASRIKDQLEQHLPSGSAVFLATDEGDPQFASSTDLTRDYSRDYTANSLELQQIQRLGPHTLILGGRIQSNQEEVNTTDAALPGNLAKGTISGFYNAYFSAVPFYFPRQEASASNDRFSLYAYDSWRITPEWLIFGGLSADWIRLPRNTIAPPVSEEQKNISQLSPRAGLLWQPRKGAVVAFSYARSLTGQDLDQSLRLDPSQFAGLPSTFRTAFPDSIVGGLSAESIHVYQAESRFQFGRGTHLVLGLQRLESGLNHQIGALTGELGGDPTLTQIGEHLTFEEHSMRFSLRQLLGDNFSLGARYQVAQARLEQHYKIDPAYCDGNGDCKSRYQGVLHNLSLDFMGYHSAGFYGGAVATWRLQTDLADTENTGTLPAEDFWQFDIYGGWRSRGRRVECQVALLNLAGQDYRLHPINFFLDPPRARTVALSLRFHF